MGKFKKNEKAWDSLSEELKIEEVILKDGFFDITSRKINEYREARLMTKFDTEQSMPEFFKKNHLSILPISSGTYRISSFHTYKKLEQMDSEIHSFSLPHGIQTLKNEYITSEEIALNCCLASGIISDFLKESGKLYRTISGKTSTDRFSFFIDSDHGKEKVTVEGARIEIDGAYEGEKSLALVEAKTLLHNDFNIRQLYYPYRLWHERIVGKAVRPVFMIYSDGIFCFYEYRFLDLMDYNSITLVQKKAYDTVENSTNEDVIVQNIPVANEPEIPFPQANNFARVLNLLEVFNERLEGISSTELTDFYSFDPRQTNYYVDAARYLGLAEKKESGLSGISIYGLSSEGRKLMKLPIEKRHKKLFELVLSHKTFRDVFLLYKRTGMIPDDYEIVKIMKQNRIYNVSSESTFKRRASTVKSWVFWLIAVSERSSNLLNRLDY